MAIRAGRVQRDVLLNAVLPTATKTYTVISHGFVINTAKQMLHDKGFNVVDEKYTALDGAQVACGAFHINYGDDPELGMLFAFANSYDKSLKFSCAIGAYVKTNETSILSKEGSGWVRMHTGKADQEASDVIEKLVDNAEAYFHQLQADKEIMKQIKLTRRDYAELLGRLFLDLKILGMEQLSSIKKEFEKPSYKYTSDPDSLWTLYNHILIGISKANPKTWMEQQKIIHFHLMDEFELTTFDEEEDETQDPNQMSLETQAEEVEAAGVTNISEVVEPTEEEVTDAVDDTQDELKPKPTISMKDAVEKYGHLVTEEEGQAMLEGKGSEEALNKIKAAYLEDQKEETPEVPGVLDGAVDYEAEPKAIVESDIEYTERVVAEEGEPETPKDLDAEEDADADAVLKEIVHEQVGEVLKEEYVKSATDGKTQLPLTKERLKELDSEINAGAILPAMPGKTPEAEIETPKVEGVSEASEVDADEEFFMTKSDLDEMNEGVVLEVGFVVTIGEDDCEIVAITDDAYGLVTLTEPEEEVVEEPVAEEVVPEIESVQEPVSMDFEIGDADESAPAETMLRTEPKVDEEQAKIDETLEVMNSKVELTKEELAERAAISIELEELYGVAPEFTYKLSNGEYTVTLASNEVVVLTEEYIKTLK